MFHDRTAGDAFLNHYRARSKDRGVFTVASQMKKQGFPLWLALATLTPGSQRIAPARMLARLTTIS